MSSKDSDERLTCAQVVTPHRPSKHTVSATWAVEHSHSATYAERVHDALEQLHAELANTLCEALAGVVVQVRDAAEGKDGRLDLLHHAGTVVHQAVNL